MTKILTPLLTANLDNDKYVQLIAPFSFETDVLAKAGLKSKVTVPTGFFFDFESVPAVRGTNKRGGTAHDYLSRIDSDPVVTKSQAAAVYFEIMEYCYSIDHARGYWQQFKDWGRRWFKWGVVYVAPGYFHKYTVMATGKEIAGIDCDPYISQEVKPDAN